MTGGERTGCGLCLEQMSQPPYDPPGYVDPALASAATAAAAEELEGAVGHRDLCSRRVPAGGRAAVHRLHPYGNSDRRARSGPADDGPGRCDRPAQPDRRGLDGPSATDSRSDADPDTPPPTSDTEPPPTPDRSLKKNSIYTIDLDGTRVRCSVRVRSAKPPLAQQRSRPVPAHPDEVHGQGVQQAAGRGGLRADHAEGQGLSQDRQVPLRPAGPERRPGVLLPDRSDDLLAGDPRRRERGVHLRPARLRRPRRPRVRSSPAVGDRDVVRVRDPLLRGRQREGRGTCSAAGWSCRPSASKGCSCAPWRAASTSRSNDRSQIRLWHGFTGDEDPPASRKPDHGTSSAQIRWLFRGLDSQDFGRCNTWKATPGRSVK